MTFQTGFAVKEDFPISEWVYDAADGPADAVNAPQRAERGMLLEVDDAIGHARLRLPSGGYVAGEFPPGKVVDLNAYAAERIMAITKRQDAEMMVDAALKWIEDKQIFWWKRNAYWLLDVRQLVRATELNQEQELVVVDAVTDRVLANIPINEINLNDLEFAVSAQERQERQNRLADHAMLPLTRVEEVMELLAKVEVIAPYLPTRPPIVIELARDDNWFEYAALNHLMRRRSLRGSDLKPADINALTDKTDPGSIKILLRRGAQGVGTEVHEMLHALSAEEYGKGSWFFFDEGITEYLTQMATVGRFDRTGKYPAECDFIRRLVTIGATDDATLARLYFTGDWAGFEATLRKFVGAWVSFEALRTLDATTCLAACDYLKELHKDPEAPLGKAP